MGSNNSLSKTKIAKWQNKDENLGLLECVCLPEPEA